MEVLSSKDVFLGNPDILDKEFHWPKDSKYKVIENVDMEKFRPMPHHIVVRWLRRLETKGGVLIPEIRERANYCNGIVLKGSDCTFGDIKKDDLICFDSLAEKEFIGGQQPSDRDPVFIMREEDVMYVDDRPHDEDGKILEEGAA